MSKNSEKKYRTTDYGHLSSNGNFYFTNKEPFYIKLTWIIDGILAGLIYTTSAVILSFYVDKYAVKDLNTSDNKFYVFIQFCGEVLYLVLVLYIIALLWGKYLPSLAYRAPIEHYFLRNYICGFCSIFGIVATDPKLQRKIRYVLGTES